MHHHHHTLEDLAEEEVPLVPDGTGDDGADQLAYDEDGSLAVAQVFLEAMGPGVTPSAAPPPALVRLPCSVNALNGSWYLHLVPQGPHLLQQIRGPMRIE